MQTVEERQNNLSTVCIKLPKKTGNYASEHAKVKVTKKYIYVNATVHRDTFLIDYMLRWIFKFNIPIDIFGKKRTTKEISEAGAGLYYSTSFETNDTSTRCYVVGEGKFPKISMLLSKLKPEWDIISIDPIIPKDAKYDCNVTFISDYDYNVSLDDQNNFENIVIIGVHSHNDMKNFYKKITVDKKVLVVIPCCVPVRLKSPQHSFECTGIVSAKNKVLIWSQLPMIRHIPAAEEIPDISLRRKYK